MVDPVNQYYRIAPPADPESAARHLDGEFQKIERATRELLAKVEAMTSSGAPLDSPVFTGNPEAPTPIPADDSTSLATTAFVKDQDYATNTALTAGLATKAASTHSHAQSEITGLVADLAGKEPTIAPGTYAPLTSPGLLGVPTAPTAAVGTNTDQLASTAYVLAAAPWKLLRKTTDQVVSATTAYADDTQLQFPVAANKTYAFKALFTVTTTGTGGYAMAVNGPSGTTRIRAGEKTGTTATTAYNTPIVGSSGAFSMVGSLIGFVTTGATAGTLALRLSQSAASGTATFEKGSILEYMEVA